MGEGTVEQVTVLRGKKVFFDGSGSGSGSGSGYGYGDCDGYGDGSGYGDGDGYGYGEKYQKIFENLNEKEGKK